MLIYRTRNESDYLERLNLILEARIEHWRGNFTVANDGVCFPKAQLVTNFRHLYNDGPYWQGTPATSLEFGVVLV